MCYIGCLLFSNPLEEIFFVTTRFLIIIFRASFVLFFLLSHLTNIMQQIPEATQIVTSQTEICWCTYFSRLECNHAPCSGKKNPTCSAPQSLIFLEDVCACDEEIPMNIFDWILVQEWPLSCFLGCSPPLFFLKRKIKVPSFFQNNCIWQGIVQEWRSETSRFLPDKPSKLMTAKILKWTKLKNLLWDFKYFTEKHWPAKW